MHTVKEEVQTLLKKLPDDCTMEDVQYHLYVIEKIQKGLERADNEKTLTQEQMEERLKPWLTE